MSHKRAMAGTESPVQSTEQRVGPRNRGAAVSTGIRCQGGVGHGPRGAVDEQGLDQGTRLLAGHRSSAGPPCIPAGLRWGAEGT